jgi:hypothetical protein
MNSYADSSTLVDEPWPEIALATALPQLMTAISQEKKR